MLGGSASTRVLCARASRKDAENPSALPTFLKRQRRVQYSLFLQVIDVETSLIKFQQTVDRTKAVKG